jgi:hypothetical protein
MFPVFGPDVAGSAFNPALITALESQYPGTISSTGPGSSVDTNGKTGQFFAVQEVGSVASGSITGKLQSSPDNTTWTDISGAAFSAVNSNNNIQVISFTTPARYVRYYATITGLGPTASCLIITPNQ